MRLKLTIEYAGTRYSGWQIQENARTVQGEIDSAVREVTGAARFELYGAGRTDAGVHALGQVAHLDVQTLLAPEVLRRRLNEVLPSDIAILRAERASHRFHARHDAVSRSYLYQISRRRSAFAKNFVWWVRDDLDLKKVRAAAQRFSGMNDFRSFTDDSADEKSMIAYSRVKEALEGWERKILEARLVQAGLPETLPTPVKPEPVDLAKEAQLSANIWSKLFPALLIIMAATGAFYPSVDLVAGEKERGARQLEQHELEIGDTRIERSDGLVVQRQLGVNDRVDDELVHLRLGP